MFFFSITVALSGTLLSVQPLTLFVVFCASLFFTRANIFHVSELLKHQICVVCCCPYMELHRPVGPYITPHYLMDVTLLQVFEI